MNSALKNPKYPDSHDREQDAPAPDSSNEGEHSAQSTAQVREPGTIKRIFLTMLDYDVGIKKSEYAKYYFILRTYASKSTRNFPLKALDVDTVRKLQSNAFRAETRFKDIHSNIVYKSI